MAKQMGYAKGAKKSSGSDGMKKMKGTPRSEAAGTRPGESAYVERRKVSKGPYAPR